MWKYPITYDVIVIGAGHAGCEAAFACARMGCNTLLLTMNLDTIGKMSCNPAVGGIGKGHIVREIDALGGEMGEVTDSTAIQFRMLNASNGPAVWAPRAQSDKAEYQLEMKRRLENVPDLAIQQGTSEELLVEDGVIKGVLTKEGIFYSAKTVILSAGTFMRGLLHIGDVRYSGGRAGDQPAVGISASLESLGFQLGRLKTGTPPRLNSRSIDYSLTEEQPGEEGVYFSHRKLRPKLPQLPCHITYTTAATKEIIQNNLHRSAMYGGHIKGVGPRYCPSVEDKIVRFADKERHQIFLEPEGRNTLEVYVNGLSTSLPFDVQIEMIHSIPALRNAEIMRTAYAIEYDYVVSGQIKATLETHLIEGLFLAGQINGTTGYEEAAGQGMMAGINAACKVLEKPPFILKRSEAYIGVMIDDLITKGLTEPYRMFTSRAEHRLLLRQDNADMRLGEYAYHLGLTDQSRFQELQEKKRTIEAEMARLSKTFKQINGKGVTLAQLLCRPEWNYQTLLQEHPEDFTDHGPDINLQIELTLKYAGYIDRQMIEVAKLEHVESILIPENFDFGSVIGLRHEAKQKLKSAKPTNLGQASRLSGVSPADISIMIVFLKKYATR